MKVGIYAWAGPGTIRLLKTKYHNPQIDTDSFEKAYDLPYLSKLKELFGVTDAWVTYSWGFSTNREKPDYQFIIDRLKNFKKLSIRTHAYIQGLNVVTKDFKKHDIYCRDPKGCIQPYSKDRSLTCPTNPRSQKIILDRVKSACKQAFDGIFIDNLIFGVPPVYVSDNYTSFFGCACNHCQKSFFTIFHYPLPKGGFNNDQLNDYLWFREQTITSLIQKISTITRQNNKQLGVNLYDPLLHTPEIYFGYSLQGIEPYLDYFLIENNLHPDSKHGNNQHLASLLKTTTTPTFVVSYKNGIGFEKQFSQKDIDSIFTESKKLGYQPCLKITEYTTGGKWHALYIDHLSSPRKTVLAKTQPSAPPTQLPKTNRFAYLTVKLFQRYYTPILTQTFKNRFLYFLVIQSGLYQKQLKTPKNYIIKKSP